MINEIVRYLLLLWIVAFEYAGNVFGASLQNKSDSVSCEGDHPLKTYATFFTQIINHTPYYARILLRTYFVDGAWEERSWLRKYHTKYFGNRHLV